MDNGWDCRASIDEKSAKVLELREQGYTQRQICEILEISPKTVCRYIRASGHYAEERIRWSEDETETLKEMLRDGYTMDDVARRIGKSWSCVYDKARRMGFLEFRRNRWTEESKLEFMELYTGGMGIAQIAKRYGMTKKSVVAYIRQFKEENVLGRTYHVGDYGELPPLTDFPKWPGCQCGYCPKFSDVRKDDAQGIIGTCTLLDKEMQRSDFCVAEEKPKQLKGYWVMAADKIVRIVL